MKQRVNDSKKVALKVTVFNVINRRIIIVNIWLLLRFRTLTSTDAVVQYYS